MDCIFCKIVNKSTSAKIVYEDEKFMAFEDINPKAPFHVLVIPKKHIHSIDHIEIEDKILMGELVLVVQKIAREQGLKGYKIGINVGREAGQIVDHLHLHLLSNK